MKCSPIHKPRDSGFTLLELVIALLLVAMLTGMIFSTANSSLVLGSTVVKTQNEEMLHQAFFDFLGNRLNSLPGNTRMELTFSDSGSHYLSDLTLQNVPMNFTWGGNERTAKAIRLSTVKRRSGLLDIVLRYYEDPILEESNPDQGPDAGNSPPPDDVKPFAEITLLTDVAYFEWRVLDSSSMEYQYDWEHQGRLPLQMELSCSFGRDSEPVRHVFWIPQRQNPATYTRQFQQNQQPAGQIPNAQQPAGQIPNAQQPVVIEPPSP